MTDLRSDLAIRPIAGVEELDLFCQLPYTLDEELADDLATGRRRSEWMWVAVRGDRLVARAAFWGQLASFGTYAAAHGGAPALTAETEIARPIHDLGCWTDSRSAKSSARTHPMSAADRSA